MHITGNGSNNKFQKYFNFILNRLKSISFSMVNIFKVKNIKLNKLFSSTQTFQQVNVSLPLRVTKYLQYECIGKLFQL